MSIFDAYNSEFASIKNELNKTISDVKDAPEKSRSAVLSKHCEALFLQANDLIKQMELEARSSDQKFRKELSGKVSSYKLSINEMKTDFQRFKDASEKSELLNAPKSGEQRQRLLDSNDRYVVNVDIRVM
jgi:hypothetical protein